MYSSNCLITLYSFVSSDQTNGKLRFPILIKIKPYFLFVFLKYLLFSGSNLKNNFNIEKLFETHYYFQCVYSVFGEQDFFPTILIAKKKKSL